ncbi:hypothetical protein Taro_035373 [Colocasia esculenta]|uniref:RRM domain-containing protein n=1 Tax=Colocasia esculenta TaxID=4460 RepID=A0A843W0B8_COLES|nr:hypothetical protein [Colocasia esculenta]
MVSMGQQMGDTTLTKVFVGGLAWETQKEALTEHFGRYGDIMEAVIIYDRATGRSKGYGFVGQRRIHSLPEEEQERGQSMREERDKRPRKYRSFFRFLIRGLVGSSVQVTFKEAEAAKKACEDAAPVINGRRANCNLAALGARRPRSSPTRPALVQPPRAAATPPQPASAAGTWYYPSGAPPPSPLQHYYRGIPFYAAYGYPPSYLADGGHSTQKLSQCTGGAPYPTPTSYPAQAGLAGPNPAVVPVYPWYHWHQQPQTMGVPMQLYTPTTVGPITPVPAIVAKLPPAVPPTTTGKPSTCAFRRTSGAPSSVPRSR